MRTITPERTELILEALQLREFGFTQQHIAKTLGVSQPTITRWLNEYYPNGNVDNGGAHINKPSYADIHNDSPLTLYPCRFEDAALGEKQFDLIIADPPYLVSTKDIKRNNQGDLQRDYGEWDKGNGHTAEWAKLVGRHLRDGGSLYLFMGFQQIHTWQRELESSGLRYNTLIVWHRTNPAPQIRKSTFCPAIDLILFMSKGPPRTFNWLGQNEMHNCISERPVLCTGAICGGNEREWHPTQKPRWLLEKLIWISSKPGDDLLDPFAGSGSTAFAAHRCVGRKVTLIEPEPQYVGLIQTTAKKEFSWTVKLQTT